MKSKAYLLLFLVLFLESCGIMGIRLKVHNPRHAGKYPRFTEETILHGELSPMRKGFDVSFYDLDIEVDAASQTLGGWVAVRSLALQDIDSIQLDLDPVFSLDSLTWGTRTGPSLAASRKYKALFIALPHRVKKGEIFTVHMKYKGRPQKAKKAPWKGGLVWKKDKQGKDWVGVACEAEGASIWFPCKDHTADEPDSARLRFTIPRSELMVVANGVYEGREEQEGKQTFTWRVHNPINLYNLTFYIGDFARIDDQYVAATGDTLHMTHYVLRPNYEKAKAHFKAVKDQVRIYEELYGPYAWYRDGFKLVESPYAGMEHQTAIAYGNKYRNDMQKVEDYIMVHEVGHEWFGNAVTAADLADVWIQEGITTYGEALFLERKYSREMAAVHMGLYKMFIKNKRPLVGPADRRYFDYKDGDVYVKGAWMLQSLRYTLDNDSLFFGVLRTFYRENAKKLTDSKAFITTLDRVTGKDYQWFFNQYLYRNRVPCLEYYPGKDGYLYYRWTDVADDFSGMPALVLFAGGEERTIMPTTRVQRLELKDPEDYRSLMISNKQTLFAYKKNKKLPALF